MLSMILCAGSESLLPKTHADDKNKLALFLPDYHDNFHRPTKSASGYDICRVDDRHKIYLFL